LHGIPIDDPTPESEAAAKAAFFTPEEAAILIDELKKKMKKHAENLEFVQAAKCRDEIQALEAMFKAPKRKTADPDRPRL
jgi:excinuclease UvrABC nuclease subunit